MTEEQNKKIEFCKSVLINRIEQIKVNSDKVRLELSEEVLISIIYLEVFSDYIKDKKFENIEESWKFMNDIKTIIEKIFYVNHYLIRINESIEEKAKTV